VIEEKKWIWLGEEERGGMGTDPALGSTGGGCKGTPGPRVPERRK